MGKITDVACMSILWLITSLPVITIGASTAAFYSFTLDAVQDVHQAVLEVALEIVLPDVKDVHYHVQQVVAGIVLEVVDHLVLMDVAQLVEQDVKVAVVQWRQIDIVDSYLMNMK